MQQYPLLKKKVYVPPIRPKLVSRPHLIERLNTGRSSPRVDQAALHGLLAGIRESGLAPISVTQNSPNTEKE